LPTASATVISWVNGRASSRERNAEIIKPATLANLFIAPARIALFTGWLASVIFRRD
jgi:hypothetical protein